MTNLEVRIRYVVNDLWVDPSLMGWSNRFESNGDTVLINFPNEQDEFTARDWEADLLPTPSAFPVSSVYDEPGWDSRTIAVRIVMIAVAFEADLPPNPPLNPFEGAFGATLQQAYERGRSSAEAAMRRFLEWVRALSRQPWLGLSADAPRQYGRGGVYYADSGEGIAGVGPATSRTFISSRLRIGKSHLDAVMAGVQEGLVVPTSQALLADAWHLTEGTDQPDRNRAIILSAMACEIKAQEHLRAAANAHNEKIVHLLLHKGSTLHYLLNDVMLAVCGTTIKESEAVLWKHVQALSANRNSESPRV
ncbi:hypothetical protein [Arthrobacter sp. NPDC092385]|uniref:hypothetical protein n=1 Tax=Arthrobacter sp. NPDC092385 TaxID=3363943 RepID=UPI00130E6530|nr:hypothetical protein [Vibrio cholerae]